MLLRELVMTCAAGLLVWESARLLPENSPVARGAEQAYLKNCIGCHGQPGERSPNGANLKCTSRGTPTTHPAYGGDCRDLLAYFEAVRTKRSFESRAAERSPNRLLRGERLARRYSCFQCHGELGQGGFRNPGALKGYVPGFFGKDFALLTRGGDTESVRNWIRQGIDPALFEPILSGAVAKFFVERQAVNMPDFSTLPESEIRILVDYVMALNQLGPMGARELQTYRQRSQDRTNTGVGMRRLSNYHLRSQTHEY